MRLRIFVKIRFVTTKRATIQTPRTRFKNSFFDMNGTRTTIIRDIKIDQLEQTCRFLNQHKNAISLKRDRT